MQVAAILLLALLPQLVDRTKEPLRPEPPGEGLSAEQRADVFMVRKMYARVWKPTYSPRNKSRRAPV